MQLGLFLTSKRDGFDEVLITLAEANGPTDPWHRDGGEASALKDHPVEADHRRAPGRIGGTASWGCVVDGQSSTKALSELYGTIGFGGGAPGSWTFKSAVSARIEQSVNV